MLSTVTSHAMRRLRATSRYCQFRKRQHQSVASYNCHAARQCPIDQFDNIRAKAL